MVIQELYALYTLFNYYPLKFISKFELLYYFNKQEILIEIEIAN